MPSFYVNGVAYNAVVVGYTSTGAQIASTSTMDIGARAAGSTFLDGAVQFVGLWNRALSADEIESLRGNHAQIYQAPTRKIWVRASAVSGFKSAYALGSNSVINAGITR